MKEEKKAAGIKTLVNWFYGNYCARKCYDEVDKQHEHWEKLQELAKKLEGVQMAHKDFLHMLRSDKTICRLSDEEWKSRKFSWTRSDCQLCRKLGIR